MFRPIYDCDIHCFNFQEEDESVEDFESQQIYDFQNGCRVTALAWSPETSTVSLPKIIRFVIKQSSIVLQIRRGNNDNFEIAIFHHKNIFYDPSFEPWRLVEIVQMRGYNICFL